MTRLLALLLAVFIGGPTCFCPAAAEVAPPPPTSSHNCCHADDSAAPTEHSSKHAPTAPCGCNKCLVKRAQASDPPQIPSITWSFATPVLTEWTHDIAARPAVCSPAWLIDTGPPHERQAIFTRH